MKTGILAVSAIALLAACGHTEERTIVERQAPPREVVVERPTVIEKQTIVEKQVPVQSYRSCMIGSSTYSDGSISCMGGMQYRCTDGLWQGLSGGRC